MSFSPSLVYDFIFLAVFSFAAVKSWQKGFLAGLTELIGAVLGVGIAFWGSRTLAPEVYLSFFSDSVSTRVGRPSHSRAAILPLRCRGWTFCRNPSVPRWPRVCRLREPAARKNHALLEPLFLPLVQRCCLCCSA